VTTEVALATVRDLLRQRARETPDAVSLIAPGRRSMLLGGFARQVEAVGWVLRSNGLQRTDAVAVVVPAMAPEGAVAIIGTLCACCAVPLSSEATVEEARQTLARTRVRALLTLVGVPSPARDVARELGLVTIELATDEAGSAGALQLPASWNGEELPDPSTADDLCMVTSTSGTTARPRLIPRRQAYIHRGMVFGFKGPEPGAALSMAPMHTATGWGTVLTTCASGDAVVFPASLDPAHLLGLMADHGVTAYIGNPVIHEGLLKAAARHPETAARCRLRIIFSAGTALPLPMAVELKRVFKTTVLTGYGMTETSLIAAHDPTTVPGKEHTVGRPIMELRIAGDDGHTVAASQEGEVQVRCPDVGDGYLDDPQAIAESMIDGWFRTGDLGYLDQDGYLAITGRLKEQINRGTLKVSPFEVEAVLREHPGVHDAVVFPLPHASRGEDVATAVVRADPKLSADHVRDHAIAKLSAYKVPRQVFFVDEIPTRLGKVPRLRMAEFLGVGPEVVRQRQEEVSLSVTEAAMASIWERMLGLDGRVAPEDDFFVLGGDSLQAVEMSLGVEEELGVRLTQAQLLDDASLGGLSRAVEAHRAAQAPRGSAPVLVNLQPEGDLTPLIWVHDGVGSVFAAGNLAFYLGSRRPVVAIEPPGMDGTGTPESTVEAMTDSYLELLRPLGRGPWILGGHSLGGVVAYELARRLEADGQKVTLLFVVEAQLFAEPPELRNRNTYRARRFREAGWRERGRLAQRFVAVRLRPEPATDFEPDVWRTPEAVARTFAGATLAYRPQPWPGSMLFVKARGSYAPNSADAWRPLVGSLEIAEVDGDHGGCMREPYVGEVGRILRDRLAELESGE
jgi:acyl-CoA synthetase (AMP-forming)/AMP-acid ligase II/thioesterase domain-containing protein/acyl carrier protein